jgi:hypothetical protein
MARLAVGRETLLVDFHRCAAAERLMWPVLVEPFLKVCQLAGEVLAVRKGPAIRLRAPSPPAPLPGVPDRGEKFLW